MNTQQKQQLKAGLGLLQNKLGVSITDFENEIQAMYCGTLTVTKLGGTPLRSHWIMASQKERDDILAKP